jgi:hypothetical protein
VLVRAANDTEGEKMKIDAKDFRVPSGKKVKLFEMANNCEARVHVERGI